MENVTIRLLEPFALRAFMHFVGPADVTYAAGGQMIAFGAQQGEKPVGLALAKFVRPGAVRIVALSVDEAVRRCGIGRELYARLEAELRAKGAELIDILADNPHPFLVQQGYQLGAPLVTVYTFSEQIGEAPWIHTRISTEKYKVFPWTELQDRDREQLQYLLDTDPVARKIDPMFDTVRMYGPTSKGIRHGDELAGWCVTQRVASDTLLYGSVYVAPRYRRTIVAPMVVSSSIREHLRRKEEFPTGVQAVPPELPEIERFAAKRLAPWADKIENVHVWWKTVSANP